MGSFILLKRFYIWALFFHCSFAFAKISKTLRQQRIEGTVHVHGNAAIAETRPNFVCATLDWWPASKCENKICGWGNSSLLNLDLKNKMLVEAIRAFSHLTLRLGGSLQNRLTYETEDHKPKNCSDFLEDHSELFGFTTGCLSLRRWDDLNKFFKETGASAFFGLNALTGRSINHGAAQGPWDDTDTVSLIKYTLRKGYSIIGWEFGNELSGKGVRVNISLDQYVHDTRSFKHVLKKLYENVTMKPELLAPGGFYDEWWFRNFIGKTTQSDSLDVLSYHIYNLGSGVDTDLVDKILNVTHLDKMAHELQEIQDMLKNSSSRVEAWVSESGGAYSGGGKISNTYIYSFWYLNQLGMASAYDTKIFCRQTLVGGNYGLLDTTTFKPNPDYYSALLWQRLMGKRVLKTTFNGTENVQAYAHCAKNHTGITLLLINLDRKTTVRAKIKCHPTWVCHVRDEYHLTAKDGYILSRTMLLNGKPLEVGRSGTIPSLRPRSVISFDPIIVANLSIVFAHLKNASAEACT